MMVIRVGRNLMEICSAIRGSWETKVARAVLFLVVVMDNCASINPAKYLAGGTLWHGGTGHWLVQSESGHVEVSTICELELCMAVPEGLEVLVVLVVVCGV